MYEYPPDNVGSVSYETKSYTVDSMQSNIPVLTEEMLLRSHANNGGKFPTHLLTKLGSQIYDMPSEQVELTNDGRRITTTTRTTRYYTVEPGETGYESPLDEINEITPRYAEEKYVLVKSSAMQDAPANQNGYSSKGANLDGEQLNS